MLQILLKGLPLIKVSGAGVSCLQTMAEFLNSEAAPGWLHRMLWRETPPMWERYSYEHRQS